MLASGARARAGVRAPRSSRAACASPSGSASLAAASSETTRGGGFSSVSVRVRGASVGCFRRTAQLAPVASSRRALVVSAKGGKGRGGKKKEDNGYGHTVLLPSTDFEMRANSATKEPAMQEWWASEGVYEEIASRPDAPVFTLHDGPPYANGDLHIGHALNKILKDFVNRYQMMRGKRVRYVPGWDCHGLPIELKVLQSMDPEARKALTPIKLRKKARQFALKTVDAQRASFKRYGCWADWEDPYLTLLPEYEAAQMEVFGKMFLNGHVYRGEKPVHWSPSSMTALAEAELEYPEGHVSRSVYVAFPIADASSVGSRDKSEFPAEHLDALTTASLAVWTTTPWTMPANAAVAVNDQLDYALVEMDLGGEGSEAGDGERVKKTLVVAEGLVDAVREKLGASSHVTLCTFKGAVLEGLRYSHPMYPDRAASPVVIGGEYITTESGTGLVHTAPGHGQEDYLTGLKHGLPLLSPVDDAGDFTAEAGADLEGKNVLGDGNDACVEALRASGALLLEEAYGHKYPYDWRTKKPTIFRATAQWFASVEGFRDEALEALDDVTFIPASGAKRMRPMVSGRNDWCISRQRAWGVPIPCFYDATANDEPLMNAETIAHVTAIVAEKGTDAWWELPIEDLLPDAYKSRAADLVRGTDTMDVWFDSGSSWAGVVKARGLKYPADMYLEGSDQHRGWFQSSLLTGVAAEGKAPYETVLTHGFVLDEKGFKMSKSLGNVVDPKTIIEGGKNQKTDPAYGADTLRMWVASTDYTGDVLLGQNVLKQTSEQYRKLRGTVRFLMGNVGDFDPAEDAVPHDELPPFDRFVLRKVAETVAELERAYEAYQYSRVTATIVSLTAFLSNVFLDVSKDRLYVDEATGEARRAAQTTVRGIVETLLGVLAPVAPHMAEEAHRALPHSDARKRSIFLQGWPTPPAEWTSGVSDEEYAFWTKALAIRGAANRAVEEARREKAVGASLEAKLLVHCADAALADELEARSAEMKPFFIVSEVAFAGTEGEVVAGAVTERCVARVEGAEAEAAGMDAGAVTVGAGKAGGAKCARCWGFSDALGGDERHPELCPRCTPIVVKIDPGMVWTKKAEEVDVEEKVEA